MELISREDCRNLMIFKYRDECRLTLHDALLTINQVRTIESRPTGVWVGIDEEPHEEWECNNCGNIINTYMQDELEEYEYCHKCGAKMSTPWVDMEGEE